MLQFFSQFTITQIINQVIQSNFNYPISENLDIPRALRQKNTISLPVKRSGLGRQ